MTKLEKIFQLANQAKNITMYDIANAIFAYLLQEWIDNAGDKHHEGGYVRYIEDGEALRCFIETEDQEGVDPKEVYYDLISFARVTAQKNWGVGYLCIPVPLLTPNSSFSVAKAAPTFCRGEHNREILEEDEEEKELLIHQLLTLVDHQELKKCAEMHLEEVPKFLTHGPTK